MRAILGILFAICHVLQAKTVDVVVGKPLKPEDGKHDAVVADEHVPLPDPSLFLKFFKDPPSDKTKKSVKEPLKDLNAEILHIEDQLRSLSKKLGDPVMKRESGCTNNLQWSTCRNSWERGSCNQQYYLDNCCRTCRDGVHPCDRNNKGGCPQLCNKVGEESHFQFTCSCRGNYKKVGNECVLEDPNDFRYYPNQTEIDACVADTNSYRRRHAGTSDLEWDENLATDARHWAQHLAAVENFRLVHDENRGEQGENLATSWPSNFAACNLANQAWHDEEKDYDYRRGWTSGPRTNSEFAKIGHFTQLVWKSSRKFGVGIAVKQFGNFFSTVVVARYSPPGNAGTSFTSQIGNPKTWKTYAISSKYANIGDECLTYQYYFYLDHAYYIKWCPRNVTINKFGKIVRLGDYKRFQSAEGRDRFIYTTGDVCEDGPRSHYETIVDITCYAKKKILSGIETSSKCVYNLVLGTPRACSDYCGDKAAVLTCYYYKHLGYCEEGHQHHSYLQENCCETCRVKTECKDRTTKANCNAWKANGHCEPGSDFYEIGKELCCVTCEHGGV